MNKKIIEFYKKYDYRIKIFLWMLLLIIVYLLFPIIPLIVLGALLAYLNYPFYIKLKKILKKRNLAALLVTLLTLLLVILPIIYLILELTNQLFAFYQTYNKKDFLLQEDIVKLIYYFVPYDELREKLLSLLESSSYYIFKNVSVIVLNILTSIPSILFKSIIIILSQFYLLIHGRKIIELLEEHLPFGPFYNIKLIKNLQKTVNSLFYGIIFPAITQTISLIIILLILQININYFLVIIFSLIFSLIPSIGSWIIWLPLSIKLWLGSEKIKAIILFIYGLIIVSNIDNLSRILVTSKIGHIPFWIVLFATLGGLLSKGFLGMVLALFFSSLAYYLWTDINNTIMLEKKEK